MLMPISASLLMGWPPAVWAASADIVVAIVLPRLAGNWGLLGGTGGGFLLTPPKLVLNAALAMSGWASLFGGAVVIGVATAADIPIDGTVVFDSFRG
jgi:hypothetical protein